MSAVGASEPVDRREALSAAFDQIESQESAPEVKVTEPELPLETPSERARDAAGKFVKAESEAPKPETKAAPQTDGMTSPAPPAEPPVWARPPKSWKPEKHERWDKIDPIDREYIYQREEESRAGIEQAIPKIRFADEINKTIEPYLPTMRGLGLEPAAAIKGLMNADYQLRTLPYDQKVAYLGQIAASYGIDFSKLGDVKQPPVMDQNMAPIFQEITTLKGEISNWKKQQEDQLNAQAMAEIEAFAKTAEHFETLKPAMHKLLNGGIAKDLPEAYTMALRLDGELSDRIAAEKQARLDAEKREKADQAAKAAKAAAVSVKTSTPGAQTSTKAQDRRAVLEEAFSNMDARL